MHLEFQPTPPKELNPEIPVWLNKLILNLLAKTAEERPRNAGEIIDYVEAQINTGQRKSVSEDKFINDLELAASQLSSNKEKFPSARNKTLVMTTSPEGDKPKRSFKGEVLATLICIIVAGIFYYTLDRGLTFLITSLYAELESGIIEPSQWTFESLAKLNLTIGFLVLVGIKAIFSGASLFLPVGAATGSLKSTFRVFLLGVVWCSLVVLATLILGLTKSEDTHLLVANPDGFSLIISSLRLALASVTLDPKIWSVQKVVFEQGAVFYPEVIRPMTAKLNLFFQSLPLFALAILTCKLAKFTAWKTLGILLAGITASVYYFIGGAETGYLFNHSNPTGLIVIIFTYTAIVVITRLFAPKVGRRK